MSVFFHAAEQMLVLFILLLVGIVARRCKLTNDKFDTMLSALVMNVALPAMILNSVLSSENLPTGHTIATIFLCSALGYAIIVAFSLLIVRLLYRRLSASAKATHSFMIAFGNVGFIGYPVLNAVLGPQAVLYGAINNIPFNIACFTAGVSMFRRGEPSADGGKAKPLRRKVAETVRSLVNPCMVACLLAIALALLGITDTEGVVGKACETLGQLTVPASMLVVGSSLAKMSLRSVFGHVLPYVTALLRLVAIPLIMYAIFHFIVSDRLVLGVLVLGSAMPVATMGAMFCLLYGGDMESMMRGTFLSTVFSLITIPLISLLVV